MNTYEKIDDILKKQKRSRRWLAQQLQIPPTTLQSMFSRKSTLDIELLKRIADVLKVSFAELLPGDLAVKYDEYESVADDVREALMAYAASPQEYEDVKNMKISDIQTKLLLEEIKKNRLEKINASLTSLTMTANKKQWSGWKS